MASTGELFRAVVDGVASMVSAAFPDLAVEKTFSPKSKLDGLAVSGPTLYLLPMAWTDGGPAARGGTVLTLTLGLYTAIPLPPTATWEECWAAQRVAMDVFDAVRMRRPAGLDRVEWEITNVPIPFDARLVEEAQVMRSGISVNYKVFYMPS